MMEPGLLHPDDPLHEVRRRLVQPLLPVGLRVRHPVVGVQVPAHVDIVHGRRRGNDARVDDVVRRVPQQGELPAAGGEVVILGARQTRLDEGSVHGVPGIGKVEVRREEGPHLVPRGGDLRHSVRVAADELAVLEEGGPNPVGGEGVENLREAFRAVHRVEHEAHLPASQSGAMGEVREIRSSPPRQGTPRRRSSPPGTAVPCRTPLRRGPSPGCGRIPGSLLQVDRGSRPTSGWRLTRRTREPPAHPPAASSNASTWSPDALSGPRQRR